MLSDMKKAILQLRAHTGMSDLLTYLMALDDATILHKDGALSRHFCYVAPDLESSNASDRAYHADTWRQALQMLDNGWMLETNVLSHVLAHDQSSRVFPEVVSALIDDERRAQYQSAYYFRSVYYLSISYKPEQATASQLSRFATESDSANKTAFDEVLAHFNRLVHDVVSYLQRALGRIAPLQNDALTTFLHQCITHKNTRLKKASIGHFLDGYVAQDFVAGFQPKIAERYTQVLSIDDLPAHAYPAMLDALSYFPLSYRWSSRYIALNPQTARHYLKRYERHWSSQAIGVLGVVRESLGMPTRLDPDAEQMAEQVRDTQAANSAGEIGHGFYTSVLLLSHEDRTTLNQLTEQVVACIQQMDFQVRRETVNATEAYLGSLPGHGDYNLRKMPMDTGLVSYLLPINAHYLGAPQAPCSLSGYRNQPSLLLTTTRGQRPFHLNLHVQDVGHTAVLGPTGSGKTTLNAMLMAAHRQYEGSRIIVLDKDYSNRAMIHALSGRYYDIAEHDCALAPLARVERNAPKQMETAVAWLTQCCTLQGLKLSPAQHSALREAVERLAEENNPAYKNLNHLTLQDSELRAAIGAFNRGSYQQLLNGTKTDVFNADVMGFELGGLLSGSGANQPFNVLVIQAIFNELNVLFEEQRPTLLILEEAWLYLSHPIFLQQLTDWLKTLRKKNVAVIFVSQDLDDIMRSDAASVIQNSCMTRLYLPNAAACEPGVAEAYRAFGLSDTQIELIRHATPKRDYYYHSREGARLFQLDLGSLAQSFVALSEKKDLQALSQLARSGKADWVLDWLEYRGLTEWQDFAKQHYFSGEK